ncbi:hypothetical protein DZS_44280 [Dickeya ananatis]
MKHNGSLSRQIIRSMILLVLSVTLMMVVGSYLFYGLMLSVSPESLSPDNQWMPTTVEWFWMGGDFLTGVADSGGVSRSTGPPHSGAVEFGGAQPAPNR